MVSESEIRFTYPLREQAPISQNFGENPDWYKRFGLPGHNGLDLAVPAGTPVLAAAPGTVVKTGFEADGYGNYVKVAHGSRYVSIYAHLSEIQVKNTLKVEPGRQIGLSGSTGFSTGPHLHFEVRLDNTAIDPLPLLSSPPILKSKNEGDDGGVTVATVTAARLNIRAQPTLSAPVIGQLEQGKKITILERSVTIWVKIGANAWVAHTFNNEPYLEEIQP
jgi:murein DD-endopeptidase MepM/ murein hydrolase activator NlpD